MEAVNGSTFKSEGSITLHFKLGNQHFRHGIYTCSIINGDGLLGTDFLEKHQTRILLDKDKLILGGTIELRLVHERPRLVSHVVDTKRIKDQKRSRVDELLKELEDIPEEVKPLLIDKENIFALDVELTDCRSIIKHTIDRGDAQPVA
ncbi:hypothetical protein ACTXT7_006116 [Hymenolepis weldensis]